MKVNREELLHCLESVQPGLSTSEITEQSNCVALKDGWAFTYNDEISCRAPSPLNESIVGSVRAEKLLELLRLLPEEEVQISAKDEKLSVVGKGRKGVFTMESDITLPIDDLELPEEWTNLPEDFCEAIKVVQQCASTDKKGKKRLTNVHIHPKWVEASDNYQICRWKLKTLVAEPILVQQTFIKWVPQLGMTEFAITDSWMHFRNQAGLILSCRRYLDDFDNMSKELEVEGEKVSLPKGLVEASEKAKLFSSENPDSDRVLVEIGAGKVRVKGTGVSGYYVEVKKVGYSGPELAFFIRPELLSDIVTRHNECIVNPKRMKVDTGSYVYVACLKPAIETVPEEVVEAGTDEEDAKEELKVAEKKAKKRVVKDEEE
jgi:hypothetical protein